MKKFLLPLQNRVRADLFSGSLAVWNALVFSIHFPNFGGGGEIRTHGPVSEATVFKTVPLDHSGTPP
ncbi:MAG: hypothetical protein HW401_881 [Parcubacteria group bacterium]|nr:hypothetical protein [Parcubacteria group bacterium]